MLSEVIRAIQNYVVNIKIIKSFFHTLDIKLKHK